MDYLYKCENGFDVSIDCFDSFEDAYNFAMTNKEVVEIWEYETYMGEAICLCWCDLNRL